MSLGVAIRVLAIVAITTCTGTWTPSGAAAQPSDGMSDTERARAEFKAGVALLKEERWVDAQGHLREALSLRDSPVIAYNLALSLVQGGKVVEGLGLLDGVLANANAKPGLLEQAASLKKESEPRLAHIELHVKGDAREVRITLDGSDLGNDALAAPIAADAGRHEFIAYRGEEDITHASVTLTEGSTVSLDLALPRAERATAAAVAPVVPTPAQTAEQATPTPTDDPYTASDEGSLLENPWFWAGTGAVVVGVIVTVAIIASGDDAPRDPTDGSIDTIRIGE